MSISYAAACSSSDPPLGYGSESVVQVNESVYKFNGPTTPNMQVLFFHGLQFDDSSDSYLHTWESKDKSCIWPQKWLLKDFPSAQILYISYDGAINKTSHFNSDDSMYLIGENLVCDLLQANVGQIPNCPVIMVGHCFGGIVIKQLCLHARNLKMKSTKLETFLDNIKGVFYYSTPHHGSDVFEKVGDANRPLWSYFRVLSEKGARLNHEFDQLRESYGWQIHGLGAGRPVQTGQFKGLVVVEEASAREGYPFNVREEDHFGNCKPRDQTKSGYYSLTRLLDDIASGIASAPKAEVPMHQCHGLPDYPTGLERRAYEIVLDDVNHEKQIRVLPKLNDLGNGSRLIITSRDQGVLNCLAKCDVYEVDFLNYDEAKKLFCRNVFQEEGIPDRLSQRNHELKEDVEGVVRKCDGLPLTLEVMGCHLRCQQTNAKVWKETINRLGNAQAVNGRWDDRVFSSLKVSCDALSAEERAMFIDAGTFFFSQPVEHALAAWSTAYGNSYSGWTNLLSTSMVKEHFFQQPSQHVLVDWTTDTENLSLFRMGKGDDRRQVWVHEHLRDLAEKLSEGATVSRRMGDGDRALDLLNVNVIKSDTKHLRLMGRESLSWDSLADKPPTFQLKILDQLEELKYLELDNVAAEGLSKNRRKKLSLLIWRLPPMSQYPPINLRGMNSLAVLKLESCRMAKDSLDALVTFTNLRILVLRDIHKIWRLPETFDQLSQLNQLELTRITDLIVLPPSIGNLLALEELVLDGLAVKVLPRSIGNLSSLANLYIRHCDYLESLPESFGRLSCLEELRIYDCDLLTTLPENFGDLKALKRLFIRAKLLGALPDNFGNLAALEVLRLSGSRRMKTLPASFGNLSSLERLEVKWCNELQRLEFSSIGIDHGRIHHEPSGSAARQYREPPITGGIGYLRLGVAEPPGEYRTASFPEETGNWM
ncbi:unnamed protein product [Calypogeia fissa]